MRYSNETKEKENGVVYTPADMAKYLSEQMIKYSSLNFQATKEISILDPAVGSGELLIALIKEIKKKNPKTKLIVVGYETDNSVQQVSVLPQAAKVQKSSTSGIKEECMNQMQ